MPSAENAALAFARPRPLARRIRRRSRLSRGAGASVALHLLLLALLLVVRPTLPKGDEEPPTVEMVFGQNGSAGLAGPSVPQAEQGAQPTVVAPAPTPLEPPPAPPQPQPQPAPTPPVSAPAAPTPPSPAPRIEQAERRPPTRPHPVRRAVRSSNPFANLTDLSLAPTEASRSPDIARRGRGGSGRAVSLSIGPLVQGGHLSMPFSVHGGHGITSDYQEMLDDWVNAHKYYPQSAADRGHDGEVALHVVWDRNGRVLRVSRIYSSGDDDLDDAWMGLFRGAHLPPPPPDVPGNPVEEDMIMDYELIR